jgi:hypothetical protein
VKMRYCTVTNWWAAQSKMLLLGRSGSLHDDDATGLLAVREEHQNGSSSIMLSQEDSVAPHRRIQRERRRRSSDRICQLIALLGCFQFLVVATVVSVSVFSRSSSSQAGVHTSLHQLETPSAPDHVNVWMNKLLQARTVSVQITSTSSTHVGFELRGTLIPKRAYPNLFDGEFVFSDVREPRHVVVIVQNRGYEWITSGDYGEHLERSGCLSPAQVPPLHALRTAFSTARWTPDGSVRFAFGTDLYQVKEISESFHITSSSGVNMWLNMTQDVAQPLPDFVSKVQDLPSCPRLFGHTNETPQYAIESMRGRVESSLSVAELAEEECPCTSQEKKKCLFLHGIGVHEDIGLVDTYPGYWGSIEEMLPCCSDVKFMHLNSVDSPWYDELFAERICDAMVSVARNTTFSLTQQTHPQLPARKVPVIENTVVVAHSTGNLYLASALLYEKCRLDKDSSKWIAIQGPMRGTNTANRVLEECAKPASGWSTLVQTVVRDFELCPVKNSTGSLVLADTSASRGCLDRLYAKVQEAYEARAHSNLCGISPFGLTSTSSPKFVALAKFSNHSTSENDGVVEFESCAKRDTGKYQGSYRNRNRFYKASINHDDGRLIHGDGLWGDDRKPIKWLQCQF